jgi:hypothetical protein
VKWGSGVIDTKPVDVGVGSEKSTPVTLWPDRVMVITKTTFAPGATGFGEPVLTKLMDVGDCALTEAGALSSTIPPVTTARMAKAHWQRQSPGG